jgi:hypothetical protein
MSQPAFSMPEPMQPDGRVWRVLAVPTGSTWNNSRVNRADDENPRRGVSRWFRRRTPAPVIDLREERRARRDDPLPSDPESVVLRLARLRDAGLITNSEFESERKTLLGDER